MKRLLLYVHFNKYNLLSSYVVYQLKHLRPLFSKIIFVSNSELTTQHRDSLVNQGLIDDFIQRENSGFDFAAWSDALYYQGFDEVASYDSLTVMNDTCFGPLWDMTEIYHQFEANETVDFWGMTNHRATKQFPEHLQSYFLSFKRPVLASSPFQEFWKGIETQTDVQKVIDQYETQVTTTLVKAGFNYGAVFDTVSEDITGMLHPDFTYYNPTAILKNKVPFIKVKAIDANQSITPYLLQDIEENSSYPVELIVTHMSRINYPDFPYLLARKTLSLNQGREISKKVAIHLHAFYVDLLPEFFQVFKTYGFNYDLYLTTDCQDKVPAIQEELGQFGLVGEILVTGNIGRDVLPMLKLKDKLSSYDYVGHFHTKKSKEADYWAGQSWRQELIKMLVEPAEAILTQLEQREDLGLVIADIPTFFRYNKIVDAWNEHQIAPEMNRLWQEMGLAKSIDFNALHTFVMSYGTFVWFKYDALKPLFELELTDSDVPAEPLPQNSILHAIERLLVYIAWNQQYDFAISPNPTPLTAFVDNKLLNLRGQAAPNTFVDFTYMGGIKGALKYIVVGPARAIKYIVTRLYGKVVNRGTH